MEKSIKTYQRPFWQSLLDQLTDQLAAISQEKPENAIRRAQVSMQACRETMSVLQENILQHGFQDQAEEIYFFKEVKTKFYSRLIYYHKVYNIEISRLVGSIDDQKAYFQKEFDHVKSFYDDNKFWFQYHRAAETYLDEKLFLRHRQDTPLIWRIYDINTHPSFTTGYDYIFSRIISNEWLVDYLHKAMQTLHAPLNSVSNDTNENPSFKSLTWTESKTGLLELIYACKAIGAFNGGKATTKDISDYLQQVFNIELSNPSRMFQEILRRKTGNTNFLDRLKDGYLKLIDSIENKGNK